MKRQDDLRWAARETAALTLLLPDLRVVRHPKVAVIARHNAATVLPKGVAIAHRATVRLAEVMARKDAATVLLTMEHPTEVMVPKVAVVMAGLPVRRSTCVSLSSRRALMAEALTAEAVRRRVTAADTRLQAMAEAGAIQLPAATAAEADRRRTVAAAGRRTAEAAADRIVDMGINTALDSWPAQYVTKQAVEQHVIATLPSSEARKPRVHCFFILGSQVS